MLRKSDQKRLKFLSLFCVLNVPIVAYAQKAQAAMTIVLPSWIQAIGVILAVIAAIVFMAWQYRSHRKGEEKQEKWQMARDKEHESAEIRSLLCSARHELAFFYKGYKEGLAEILEQMREGECLKDIVPVEHERYYIYPIFASNIAKVKETRLGMQILFAYAMQIKFIDSIKWNNTLLGWYRDVQKRYLDSQDEGDKGKKKELEDNLKEHLPKIIAAFSEMEVATKTILEYINEDGTINPRSKHTLHSQYYFLNSPQSVRYK